MRDLTFVVALSDGETRKDVVKRLRDHLTLLGQRHVAVVAPAAGGIEMFQLLQSELEQWWREHVVTDTVDTFICLDHEPGLRDWTASVTTTNVLVRLAAIEQAAQYEGQQAVKTVLADDLGDFSRILMAAAPSLDLSDDLADPFAGVEPASRPVAASPAVALEEDEPDDYAPYAEPDGPEASAMPSWPMAQEPEDVDLDEQTDDDQEAPGCLVDLEPEGAVASEPAPSRLTPAELPVEEDWDFAPNDAPVAAPPDPENVRILDREPHVAPDDDEQDENEPDEASEYQLPTESAVDQEVLELAVEAVEPEEVDPILGVLVDQDFFAQYGNGAQAPGVASAVAGDPPPSSSVPVPPAIPAVPQRIASDGSGVAATPHPFVLYAEEISSRTSADPIPVPGPSPAPASARRQTEPAGPASLPAPIAAVWGDDDMTPDAPPPPPRQADPILTSSLGPSLLPDDEPVLPKFSAFGDSQAPQIERWTSPPVVPVAPTEPEQFMAPVIALPRPERPVERTKPQRVATADPSGNKVRSLLDRIRPSARPSLEGVTGRLFGGHRTSSPKVAKAQHTDSELGGFLDGQRGGIVAVGALKGGVGKTAVASGLADWAGKILSPNNAAAAYVDANLNNPDAAGFFKEEIGQNMVSVRSVVAALVNNQLPPDPIKALTESVALYPERPGAVEYTRAEITRFADYLRLQYRFTVVDLANVSPSIDGGPAATAALHWLAAADVVVVPTDLNPTSSLPDAYQYIASVIGLFGPAGSPSPKPILVPYIVPPDPSVERDPEVQTALRALEGLGARLYPIPYNARVMVAGARHQSLTSISKALAQAYRAVTEAAILAFTGGDQYL